MGGSNETFVGDLRMHVSNDVVHIHDGIKFELDKKTFKQEMSSTLQSLKKEPGVYVINGKTNVSLCAMSHNGKAFFWLIGDAGFEDEMASFLRGI